jgi:hypothetical protein
VSHLTPHVLSAERSAAGCDELTNWLSGPKIAVEAVVRVVHEDVHGLDIRVSVFSVRVSMQVLQLVKDSSAFNSNPVKTVRMMLVQGACVPRHAQYLFDTHILF